MKYFLLLLIPFLVIDSTNGLLLYLGFSLPISVIYKFSILLFGLTLLLQKATKLQIIGLFTFLSLGVANIIYHHFLLHSIDTLIYEVNLFLRLFLWLVCFLLFTHPEYRSQIIKHLHLIKANVVISYFTIVINVFIGLLGLGRITYETGEQTDEADLLGFKGFFITGNDVGITFFTLQLLIYVFFYRSTLVTIFFSLLSLATALLLATKVTIMGTLLLILIRFYYTNFERVWVKPVFFSVLFSFLSAGIFFLATSDIGYINRFYFFYEKFGVLGLILSARDQFVIEIAEFAYQHFTFWDYFFGVGIAYLQSHQLHGFTELDLTDIFINFGLPLSIFIIISVFYTFLKLLINSNRYYPTILFQNTFYISRMTLLVLLFIALLSGHVITSSMVQPYACFILFLLTIGKQLFRITPHQLASPK